MEKEIQIPDGFEAKIEGNMVIFVPKESEDERIRKEIICYLNNRVATAEETELLYFKRWIAYLEKQKDLTRENIIKELEKEFYACATTPKWFHNAMQGAIDYGKAVASGEIKPPTVNLEKQKEQKSTEWSEESDKLLNYAISMTDDAQVKRFLESLRYQPKQEWSEEDEHCMHQLILFCENCMQQDSEAIRCATWLKSLRPQPHWKPTEEQMEALFTCTSVGSFGHRGGT